MAVILSTFPDKKDQFNAMTNSKPLKNFVGQELTITGVVQYTKENVKEDGTKEVSTLTAFKTSDGDFIGGVSANVAGQVLDYIDTFGDITAENPANVTFRKEKSKHDRDFLSMVLL